MRNRTDILLGRSKFMALTSSCACTHGISMAFNLDSYSPHLMRLMTDALSAAIREASDNNGATAEVMAGRIMAAVDAGEIDPESLKRIALHGHGHG